MGARELWLGTDGRPESDLTVAERQRRAMDSLRSREYCVSVVKGVTETPLSFWLQGDDSAIPQLRAVLGDQRPVSAVAERRVGELACASLELFHADEVLGLKGAPSHTRHPSTRQRAKALTNFVANPLVRYADAFEEYSRANEKGADSQGRAPAGHQGQAHKRAHAKTVCSQRLNAKMLRLEGDSASIRRFYSLMHLKLGAVFDAVASIRGEGMGQGEIGRIEDELRKVSDFDWSWSYFTLLYYGLEDYGRYSDDLGKVKRWGYVEPLALAWRQMHGDAMIENFSYPSHGGDANQDRQ